MTGRIQTSLFILLAIPKLGMAAPEAVDFARDIEPIFAGSCYKCHGPDEQKSKLRLDSPAAIVTGGDSGEPLYVVGKSAQSHLIHLVSGEDPDETMPPKGKGKPLTKEQAGLLRAWIDEGAKMPGIDGVGVKLTTKHWSFQPVASVDAPLLDHPWSKRSPIDAFVMEKILAKELAPSPRAGKRDLIRRLYLIMHGLPPTPEEVEAFLKDERAEAWPELVERVLASPRYGERWARHWLDIVRFAESNGFETNRERLTAYHFRDYVIKAFNEDKPYNQFVKEQIAGDSLNAEVATGFLVAGPYDIVKSPDINLTLMQRQDELADIVNTTGTTFLGLTLGCARCHNHKFDPILQKDFYSLQAVFAGVGYGERAIKRRQTRKDKAEVRVLQVALGAMEKELSALRTLAAKVADPATGKQGLREPVNAKLNTENFAPTEARFVRFTIDATNASQPCIDELEIFDGQGKNVALASAGSIPTSSGDLTGYPIHKLEHLNDGKFGNGRSWISNKSGKGQVQIAFPEQKTINRIAWARDRDGRFADRVATSYRIESSVDGKQWKQLASSADRQPFSGAKQDPNAFIAKLGEKDGTRARQLLSELDSTRRRIASLENGHKAWVANFSQPGATHRLYRGDPMAKREVVAPDALTVLGSLGMSTTEPEQKRRTSLANWIASAENPLTARVMANRVWQYHFGIGLVDTPSDFGANGTKPTHPELLDWLAGEFVSGGWSIKNIHRKILLSNTWQQSSAPDEKAAALDADSRYLWRFPPRRLSAEAIRDCILATAGTLDLSTSGGPGFYLLDVDRENVVHYHAKEETGPPEWRRMVYLFKIRQEQDAVFGAFDCPDGNQVIPRRSRSTTPLQALNLFNSKFIIQQSDLLTKRLQKETGDDQQAQARRAFQLFYGRDPDPQETKDSAHFIRTRGLPAFCRALFNSNEFLFVF